MTDVQFLSEIKNQTHYTNCFMFENQLFDETGTCIFDNQEVEGTFCFFKDSNYDFKHLNFFLTEKALANQQKINWKHDSFVTEIISNTEKENSQVKNWLLHQNNFQYRTFLRMLRSDKTPFHLDYSKVQQPKEEDFAEIIQYLEKTFDKHTERIPNLEKLRKIQESCYVIKEGAEIAAVLITEMKGVNQELYFMVTLPEFEGKGYGSILMTHILNNPTVSRWIMWVDASNARVLDWYAKIGYKKDKLVNKIYISKKIMDEKILKILQDTRDEFDFTEQNVDFIKAGYLDSFDIISLVADLEAAFDVKIKGEFILPENFATITSIAQLIQKSKDAS